MERIKVKPAKEGSIVRDPLHKRPIPAEGVVVNAKDPFWIRRLKDGDVVKVEVAAISSTAEEYDSQEENLGGEE